jgi:hypothetical protein
LHSEVADCRTSQGIKLLEEQISRTRRTAEAKVSRIHDYRVQHMRKRNTDKLARAKARSDPAQWGEDEVMTLVEAAAVFFPEGH